MLITSFSSWNMADNSKDKRSAAFHPPTLFSKSLAIKADNFHKQNNVRFGMNEKQRKIELLKAQINETKQQIENTSNQMQKIRQEMMDLDGKNEEKRLTLNTELVQLETKRTKLSQSQDEVNEQLNALEAKKRKPLKLFNFLVDSHKDK